MKSLGSEENCSKGAGGTELGRTMGVFSLQNEPLSGVALVCLEPNPLWGGQGNPAVGGKIIVNQLTPCRP